MMFLVMPDLVRQDRFQFSFGKLGYEGVEKDNFSKNVRTR
jgi:hypothetical protein